jgi:hypothetical protein
LLGLPFHPEDEGNVFLQNVVGLPPVYIALKYKRLCSTFKKKIYIYENILMGAQP